jgi:hypothetical protein
MTEQVTGYVERVNERSSGAGPTTYSLCVNGDWYGFYTNRPDVSEGQLVKFAFRRKGKWLNADPKTVEVLEEAGETKPTPSAGAKPAGRTFNDNRQNSIVMQSSSKTATELLGVLISAGAIHLGKAETKPAAAKRYDALMELHEELTLRLFNRATQPDAFVEYVRGRVVQPAAEDVTEEQLVPEDDDGSFTDF